MNSAEMSLVKQFTQVKSEKEFLAMKAKLAKLAFTHTLQSALSESVDIVRWTQKYPLQTTGLAALAGFMSAERMGKEKKPQPAPVSPEEAVSDEKSAPSLFEVIFETVSELVKSIVTPWMLQQLKKEIEEHNHAPRATATETSDRLH